MKISDVLNHLNSPARYNHLGRELAVLEFLIANPKFDIGPVPLQIPPPQIDSPLDFQEIKRHSLAYCECGLERYLPGKRPPKRYTAGREVVLTTAAKIYIYKNRSPVDSALVSYELTTNLRGNVSILQDTLPRFPFGLQHGKLLQNKMYLDLEDGFFRPNTLDQISPLRLWLLGNGYFIARITEIDLVSPRVTLTLARGMEAVRDPEVLS
jgi:hypothetical protein